MLEVNLEHAQDQNPEHPAKAVLIVDDDPMIRDLCSKALNGYRVIEAANGEEALELFPQGSVDVVLTDVMMPGMGGVELLKRLKEIESSLVVIMMTGFAEKDVILDALKADADDFITKPLNLLQLKTAVDKALVKKALKDEIANLKSMDRFKSNFLSLVSHKFRTPITAISLFLQNLAGGVYDPNDPMYRKYLQLTYDEACYLERLVGDLLEFSRAIDDGTGIKLDPCHPASLVRQVVQVVKDTAGKPGVTVRLDVAQDLQMLLDREKFSFAVKQIVENAFKFSSDEGTVEIALGADKQQLQLVVADQGPGIDRQDLPRIFEKFYQAGNSDSGQVHGFGLGLYYAKEFIQLHGGVIAVESEPGKGTRVTVTIPIRPA